jgi:hypothetical protein
VGTTVPAIRAHPAANKRAAEVELAERWPGQPVWCNRAVSDLRTGIEVAGFTVVVGIAGFAAKRVIAGRDDARRTQKETVKNYWNRAYQAKVWVRMLSQGRTTLDQEHVRAEAIRHERECHESWDIAHVEVETIGPLAGALDELSQTLEPILIAIAEEDNRLPDLAKLDERFDQLKDAARKHLKLRV